MTGERMTSLKSVGIPLAVIAPFVGGIMLAYGALKADIAEGFRLHLAPISVRMESVERELLTHEKIEYHRGVPNYLDISNQRIENKIDDLNLKLDNFIALYNRRELSGR